MAVEPNEEPDVEIEDDEAADADQSNEVNDEGEDEGEAEAGFEIQFGDEAAPASGERDTGLARHLRQEIRKRDDELKALRQAAGSPPSAEDPGPEPDFDNDGAKFDYDQTAFIAHWKEWDKKRAAFEKSDTERQQTARQANEQWNREYSSYQAKAATMRSRFPDYDEAEGTATAALNQVQQAVIVKVADDPALILNALGRHPGKLAEISKITDPLKLAHALAGLEKGLKVMPKRTPPAPEQITSGTARVTQGKDKELERLEKEADRTGDRTKIREYRQRRKQAA